MPVSLISAIKNKYEDDGDEVGSSELVVFVTKCAKPIAKDGLVIPPMLTMNGVEISEAGDTEELGDICKNITELDLTDNLLTEWSEVFKILNCMPKVHFLNLSENNLSSALESPSDGKEFDKMTHLILNSTAIPWPTVLQLLKIFPSLQELHLSKNGYKTLSLEDAEPHESLKQIFLNQNLVSDWSEICKLGGKFPNLDQIVLIGNPIQDLVGDFSLLQNLSAINISQSKVKNWDELAKLSELENLCDLRLKFIPLMEGLDEKEARQLCISYLPNIIRLNGSAIMDEERTDAERAFVRRFMDSEVKPERFFALKSKYGKLDPLVNVDLTPPTHVKVTVEYMETKCEVEICITQTVSQLKKDLEKVAGVPAKSFRLFHKSLETWMGREELKYPQITCYSVPIREGDTLQIMLRNFIQE